MSSKPLPETVSGRSQTKPSQSNGAGADDESYIPETIEGPDGKEYQVFPVDANAKPKFRTGCDTHPFEELIPPEWSEMQAVFNLPIQEGVRLKKDGQNSYSLRDCYLPIKNLFFKAMVRYPACEFTKKLTSQEGENILADIAKREEKPGHSEIVKKLLKPLTLSEPSDMKYYYIQEPNLTNKEFTGVQDMQLSRFNYVAGGFAERFMAIFFDLLIQTAEKIDPAKIVSGRDKDATKYIFGWMAMNTSGTVSLNICRKLTSIAKAFNVDDPLREFLLTHRSRITRAMVNLFETITKGKNYDDPGITVGMAITDVAWFVMELGKKDADSSYVLADDIGENYLETQRIGCGGPMSNSNVFVEYVIADCQVVLEDGRPTVDGGFDPSKFLKGKHGELYGTLNDLKLNDGRKIPRPTTNIRPDWILQSKQGSVFVTGEAKSTLDVAIPAGFNVSVIGAAHQLCYSDRALLVHTSGSKIRIYELIRPQEPKNAAESQEVDSDCITDEDILERHEISCFYFESQSYDLRSRDDIYEMTENNRVWKALPNFLTTAGPENFNWCGGAEYSKKQWKKMHVRLRRFFHTVFASIDTLAAALMRKDIPQSDYLYKTIQAAGLIPEAVDPGTNKREVDPVNLWRWSEQTYCIIKEYMQEEKVGATVMRGLLKNIVKCLNDKIVVKKEYQNKGLEQLCRQLDKYNEEILQTTKNRMKEKGIVNDSEFDLMPPIAMLRRKTQVVKEQKKRMIERLAWLPRPSKKEERRKRRKAELRDSLEMGFPQLDEENFETYEDIPGLVLVRDMYMEDLSDED